MYFAWPKFICSWKNVLSLWVTSLLIRISERIYILGILVCINKHIIQFIKSILLGARAPRWMQKVNPHFNYTRNSTKTFKKQLLSLGHFFLLQYTLFNFFLCVRFFFNQSQGMSREAWASFFTEKLDSESRSVFTIYNQTRLQNQTLLQSIVILWINFS